MGGPEVTEDIPDTVSPFYMPPVLAADVDEVAELTGLLCGVSTEKGGQQHVIVAEFGWPDSKYASIDNALWKWLGTPERRAAFARFAVLVPTEAQPRARVWAGVILWD